jgi:hypothetical protein
LATEVASVQRQEDPVPGTEEVRSTDGREGVPAPVGTPEGRQVQAAEVTVLKRRLANCEEALKLKVVSLTEAENR